MLPGFLGQAPEDVKRRPENGNHRLILQFRAGQQEADQGGPFGLAGSLEQLIGILRDLQQPDALLALVLIRLLVTETESNGAQDVYCGTVPRFFWQVRYPATPCCYRVVIRLEKKCN